MTTDPLQNPTVRRVVGGALVIYVALVILQYTRNDVVAGATADLLIGALAVLAAAYVLVYVGTDDAVVVGAALAFLVAGVAIAYNGIARFGYLQPSPAIDVIGTLALLAGFVLYLYRREEFEIGPSRE